MIQPLEPLAKQGGGHTIWWDENGLEHRTTLWRTRCSECKTTLAAREKEAAEEMWWDHICSEHPSVWSTYVRSGAPMSGWGEFGWTFIPKAEKVCRECEQPIKKIGDVGEVREIYPGRKRDLLCVGCRDARSEAIIARSRS